MCFDAQLSQSASHTFPLFKTTTKIENKVSLEGKLAPAAAASGPDHQELSSALKATNDEVLGHRIAPASAYTSHTAPHRGGNVGRVFLNFDYGTTRMLLF